LGQPFSGRAALLSPFDRLIHDRKRTVELFEFDYQLEMYKPAAKRRWGHFALPILCGDRLVGKLDATADRKAGVLRVHDRPGRPFHQDRDRSNRSRDQGPGSLARAGPHAAPLSAHRSLVRGIKPSDQRHEGASFDSATWSPLRHRLKDFADFLPGRAVSSVRVLDLWPAEILICAEGAKRV
jgi:hypothetical protein